MNYMAAIVLLALVPCCLTRVVFEEEVTTTSDQPEQVIPMIPVVVDGHTVNLTLPPIPDLVEKALNQTMRLAEDIIRLIPKIRMQRSPEQAMIDDEAVETTGASVMMLADGEVPETHRDQDMAGHGVETSTEEHSII